MAEVLSEGIKYVNDILKSDWNHSKLIIGISGPQGSGKTTLAKQLTQYVNDNTSTKAVNILLDDFYLPYVEQQQLTQLAIHSYKNNPLLQGRGLPGTHDLNILNKVLDSFANDKRFTVPKYDKSLHNGKGDRLQANEWESYKPDVIFLEGWFLGFRNLDHQLIETYGESQDPIIKSLKCEHLTMVDEYLSRYQRVFQKCQYSIILSTDDISNVYKWRLQQEHALIQNKGGGMTDGEIKDFVDRYMPMYKLYYKTLCQVGNSETNRNLVINIEVNRKVLLTKVV